MTTTFLKKSKGSPGHEAAGRALREAGVGVVEVEDWDEAAEELRKCEAALVVCNGELDTARLKQAISALTGNGGANGQAMAPEAARALSHDLRTPLSAMAGWVHLMESGKLDEAGLKRAITKLRGNIEDQVRVIERHLGNGQPRGTSPI
jgi:signal transduction histidine kinase